MPAQKIGGFPIQDEHAGMFESTVTSVIDRPMDTYGYRIKVVEMFAVSPELRVCFSVAVGL